MHRTNLLCRAAALIAVFAATPDFAQASCRWAGELPSDAQWVAAADTAVVCIGVRCTRQSP